MTLAVILLVGVSLSSWVGSPPAASQPPVFSIPQDQAGTAQPQSSATPAKTETSPQASLPATSGSNPSAAPKRTRHKRKVPSPNCESTSAPVVKTEGSPTSEQSPAAANAAPPTNCPPKKVIVRQGGTTEPTIQLAGGPGGEQTPSQQDTASQLLGPTEENLKKIAGHQLTPDQQDMVNQVHQFMEQTKSAVAAGDLDRARTLAWKAQTLSEELAKPKQ